MGFFFSIIYFNVNVIDILPHDTVNLPITTCVTMETDMGTQYGGCSSKHSKTDRYRYISDFEVQEILS